MSLILVLLVTGVIIWRPYFAHYFSINIVRWCLLIHATAAIVLIHAILIHIYMAFWVKGSIKGMIEGKVSRRWARNTILAGIVRLNLLKKKQRNTDLSKRSPPKELVSDCRQSPK